MNCSDFETWLDTCFDHLPDTLPDQMAGHVSRCASCRRAWSDMQTLNLAVSRWKAALPVVDLVDRVQLSLQSASPTAQKSLSEKSLAESLSRPTPASADKYRFPPRRTAAGRSFDTAPITRRSSFWTRSVVAGVATVVAVGVGISLFWQPENPGRDQAVVTQVQNLPGATAAGAPAKGTAVAGAAANRRPGTEPGKTSMEGRATDRTSGNNELAASPGIRRAAVRELQSAYRRLATEARESMPDVAGLIAAAPTSPAKRNDAVVTGSSASPADTSSSPFAFAVAVQQPLADGVTKVGNRLKPIGSDVSRSMSFLWNVAQMGE